MSDDFYVFGGSEDIVLDQPYIRGSKLKLSSIGQDQFRAALVAVKKANEPEELESLANLILSGFKLDQKK